MDIFSQRVVLSLLLVLAAPAIWFWSRRKLLTTEDGRLPLFTACVAGLAYGLFRVWVGCGLTMSITPK